MIFHYADLWILPWGVSDVVFGASVVGVAIVGWSTNTKWKNVNNVLFTDTTIEFFHYQTNFIQCTH